MRFSRVHSFFEATAAQIAEKSYLCTETNADKGKTTNYPLIKTLRNIVRWLIGTTLALYLLLLAALGAPPVRRAIAGHVSAWLSREVGARVSVGDFEVGLLNRVVLRDVLIEDRNGRELLRSGTLSAKIGWRELADGEVRLRTVALLDTRATLRRDDANGPTNFQFLIDHFTPKEKKEPSRLNLRIGSLILRRCTVSWNEAYAKETPGVFNTHHLHFTDIDANVSLRRLTPDTLSLRLRHLALREQCGLNVRRFSLEAEANQTQCHLRGLTLETPYSRTAQREIALYYDASDGFNSIAHSLHAAGEWEETIINARDVAYFVPRLQDLPATLHLSAHYDIRPGLYSLNRFDARTEGGGLSMRGNLQAKIESGRLVAVKANDTQIHAEALSVRTIFNRFLHKEVPLPLAAAGTSDWQGDVQAVIGKEYAAKGLLRTAHCGSVRADVSYNLASHHINGQVEAEGVMLAKLLGREDLPTNITAVAKGSVALPANGLHPQVEGDVQLTALTWQGYTFRNINAKGSWKNGQLVVDVDSRDPSFDLTASVKAVFDGHKLGGTDLQADVRHLYPAAIGLSGTFAESTFSGSLQADLPELRLPPNKATFLLQNFEWARQDKPLNIQSLSLKAEPSERGNRLDLICDAGELHLDGPLEPAIIMSSVRKIVERSLPGLWLAKAPSPAPDGEWIIDATISDTRLLRDYANVPLSFDGPLTVKGNVRSDGGRMVLLAETNGVKYDSTEVRNASVYLTGENGELHVVAQATKPLAQSDMRIAANLHALDGILTAQLSWLGGNNIVDNGQMNIRTTYSRSTEGLSVKADVLPSEVVLAGDSWTISAGSVTYSEKAVDVRDIAVSHADQGIRVNGRFSSDPQDSIVAQLRDVDIAYVLNLVDFDAVSFRGLASGQMSVSRATGSPQIRADIRVPEFFFNDGPMGRLALSGGFDPTKKRINLNGHMENADSGHTDVNGYVALGEKCLSLDIGAAHTNLRFLRRYIGGIFGDFEGRATGFVHLYGPFKQLDFDGELKASAEALILSTGVRYAIGGGHVKASPGRFAFEGFNIEGKGRGTGTARGDLLHEHLKNIHYDFTIQAQDLALYDQPRSIDMPFFATAYGDGTARLIGSPGEFEADITMTPRHGTMLTYAVGRPDSYAGQDFVSFNSTDEGSDLTEGQDNPTSATDIRLNMQINTTPEATLRVVMDEKTGDHIDLRGNGNIRALFYNKGRFQMFGTYTVAEGIYKMSIQDVIRKDFSLQRGGRITFSGDPYQGDLDLQAIYTVNSASLSDLGLGSGFSQNSVRVNCLLGFSGKVENPQVSFDLDLPTVNEEEKRLVRNLISSEEELTTQVLYLLGIGRFYSATADRQTTTNASAAGAQSSAAMKSFLAGTLSSQLNNIIQNAVGTSNWSFGANVSTGTAGTNDMEIEGLLSGRLLNNRLLVNGNIGYRDNSVYSNNFIGDFDVQYLLTPGGSVRLKAYSETNDRYFTKSALTTQGVGIQLSRDFTTLRDLFNVKKRKKEKPEQREK